MKTDFTIKHKDLTGIGYYFINAEHEARMLDHINDEFANRVGQRVTELLTSDDYMAIQNMSVDESDKYIREKIPEHKAIIKQIRRELLLDLKKQRKGYLLQEPGQQNSIDHSRPT